MSTPPSNSQAWLDAVMTSEPHMFGDRTQITPALMKNIKIVVEVHRVPIPDEVLTRLRTIARHYRRHGHSVGYAAEVARKHMFNYDMWFPRNFRR